MGLNRKVKKYQPKGHIQGVHPSYMLHKLSMLVACLRRKSTCSEIFKDLQQKLRRFTTVQGKFKLTNYITETNSCPNKGT